MILGQTPDDSTQRVTFQRPDQAGPGFRPGMIQTGFQTHVHPFQSVMPPIVASMAQIPGFPRRARALQPMAPAAAPAETPPAPGPTAGFGHSAINPYRAMRTGVFPGIRSNGSNIRRGAYGAGALIKQITPADYLMANVPAGGYGPMRAPAAPMPAATAGFGASWFDTVRSRVLPMMAPPPPPPPSALPPPPPPPPGASTYTHHWTWVVPRGNWVWMRRVHQF